MYPPNTPATADLDDPDLAVDEGGFESFAEVVAAALLAAVAEAVATAAVDGAIAAGVVDTAAVGDSGVEVAAAESAGGSVIAGSGADALYTLPDGSISFAGYSPGFDTSYSFDVG